MSRLKSLASDTMIYGFFTILGRFLSFLLNPFYSNYLTKEEFGDMNYFFSAIAFLAIIYCFGMDAAFLRFYDKDDLKKSKQAFSAAYIFIFIFSGLLTTILFVYAADIAPSLTNLDGATTLMRFAILVPFLDVMMTVPYGLLRMTRRAKKFAVTRLILVIIAVLLNIVLIWGHDMGAHGVFLAQLITNIIGVCFFVPEIIKYLMVKINWSLIRQMFRFGLPTIPAAISGMILQVGDKQILKFMAGSEQLAMYSMNYKLGIPMMMFVSIFDYAWKPFYLNHYKDEDAKPMFARVLTYFTIICAFIFLMTAMFVGFAVQLPFPGGNLINSVYWSGLGIVPIVLAGYFFNGMFYNLAAGFHIRKKTDYLPIAVGLASAVNISFNLIFIPKYGYWASAWATILAYIVSSGVLLYFARKIYPIKYEWRKIGIIVVLTIAIYFTSMIVTSSMDDILSLIIRIGFLGAFAAMLRITGLLTEAEIAEIKKLFRRKK